jgi:pimeloyl-ACP methyl ester carboxylesterase
VLVLLALLIMFSGALLGIAWYFSSQLLDVDHSSSYSLTVLSVGKGTVTLERNDDTTRPGTYGLEWRGGHAVMGRVIRRSGQDVTRALSAETGSLRRGTKIGLTASIYHTPADVKMTYRTIHFPDSLGPMPAWYVPARGHIWAIVMHGYKSQKTEGIRPIPVFHALGMPVLDIAYRNDRGAPYSPDHIYHLGATEWRDAAAAAKYALSHGATSLVLMGYSMGGNLTEELLHHSRYASHVRAVVLDSPAVDWDAILDRQADNRHLPGFVTWISKRVIAFRMGLSSLGPVDTDKTAGALHTPTLLFDGKQDALVPFRVYTSFVDHSRPGTVTVVTVPAAGHTEPWNVQPRRYETALRTFLTRVLGLRTTKHR